MEDNSIWNSIDSLLVVINSGDDAHLQKLKKSLDHAKADSNIRKLIIVALLPKGIDKNTMTPDFSIYFIASSDFNFWGKLKDPQLINELNQNKFDTLVWIGDDSHRFFNKLKKISFKNKIGVNAYRSDFEMSLNSDGQEPSKIINFVKEVLLKSY